MNKVIHIGANKSASTTLQRHLFSKCEDIVYVGEDCERYEENKKMLDSLVSDDSCNFSYVKTKQMMDQYLKQVDSQTFLYSNEDVMTSRVPSQCRDRLFHLLPDSKILLIMRNQFDAIISWYANHGAYLKQVPRRYWRKHVEFDEWMNYCLEFFTYSPLTSFLYHKHLALYASSFGKENIRILLFEDFIHNKDKFLEQLTNLLQISKTKAEALIHNKHERPRSSQKKHNIILSKEWKDKIRQIYAEDNHRVMQQYGVDLHQYNYPSKY